MVANWIYSLTGARWPVSLARVMLWLVVCLLIGALTPAAVFALGYQDVGVTASTTPAAQPTTYRYTAQPDGTTEVQRSNDGGLTWPAVGIIPEAVAQLTVNPTNDTVVLARTGASLWRSRDSGASWARIDSLPARPIALAFAGSSDRSGLIFAGTDTQGLYSSLDSGKTWQAAGRPLSPMGAGSLAVTALAINPGDQQVVYAAATFTMATPQGRHSSQSVFISVNDGRRWFVMAPAPGPDRPITQLLPLSGPFLAVSLASPLGSTIASLEINQALMSGLDDADAGTRAATARALGLSYDRSLLLVLMSHLRDTDLLAGDQVAQAIGRLGDPAAVPLLMAALSDTDDVIRARAATALGLLQAKAAIPQLDAMLQHEGPWARRYAAEALAAIGTPDAITALIGPLRDAEMTPVRNMAMHGLELAGRSAVTPLRLALLDQNPVVRRNAAEMLGWLRAADAVPDLVQSLSDQDAAVRTQADWALGEIHTVPAQLALGQVARSGEAGRPILQTTNAAHNDAPPGVSVPQSASVLPSMWSNALALVVAGRWLVAALASLLALAILAAMLLWKGPRQHLRRS